MLVDSHCHLDYPDLQRDFSGVMARAKSAGVETMLAIGTKLRDFDAVRAIAALDAVVEPPMLIRNEPLH